MTVSPTARLIFVVHLVAIWRYSPGVHRAIHDGTHRAR